MVSTVKPRKSPISLRDIDNLKNVASSIAEKLREGVESLNIPHQSSSVSTCLTISLGVSCSQNAPDEKSIFEMADANLYLAKEFGRNRVEPLPN
ncbi:MAG: GGDEF domain-containing protein [Marinomonas sp.]